jgi:hypothetical protein
MSRGPGRIERAIETLFAAEPSRTFSTDELVKAVYRGVDRVEKKHRITVLRAADKVAKRLHWAKWQCERGGQGGGGRGAVYVNLLDPRSYGLGRLRIDSTLAGKSMAELESMLDGGEGAKRIAPGGAWWRHVEEAKAKLLGRVLAPEVQRVVDAAEQDRKWWIEGMRTMSGVSPEERERRARRREANAHGRICGRCGKPLAPDAAVVRGFVATRGFIGYGAQIEVQCLDCGRSNLSVGFWLDGNCEGCGRKVHCPSRRYMRHIFCCDDCRKRAKRKRVAARRAAA